jgi:hypothetical protein
MESVVIRDIVDFLKKHMKLEVKKKTFDMVCYEETLVVKIGEEVITEVCLRQETLPDWG